MIIDLTQNIFGNFRQIQLDVMLCGTVRSAASRRPTLKRHKTEKTPRESEHANRSNAMPARVKPLMTGTYHIIVVVVTLDILPGFSG